MMRDTRRRRSRPPSCHGRNDHDTGGGVSLPSVNLFGDRHYTARRRSGMLWHPVRRRRHASGRRTAAKQTNVPFATISGSKRSRSGTGRIHDNSIKAADGACRKPDVRLERKSRHQAVAPAIGGRRRTPPDRSRDITIRQFLPRMNSYT